MKPHPLDLSAHLRSRVARMLLLAVLLVVGISLIRVLQLARSPAASGAAEIIVLEDDALRGVHFELLRVPLSERGEAAAGTTSSYRVVDSSPAVSLVDTQGAAVEGQRLHVGEGFEVAGTYFWLEGWQEGPGESVGPSDGVGRSGRQGRVVYRWPLRTDGAGAAAASLADGAGASAASLADGAGGTVLSSPPRAGLSQTTHGSPPFLKRLSQTTRGSPPFLKGGRGGSPLASSGSNQTKAPPNASKYPQGPSWQHPLAEKGPGWTAAQEEPARRGHPTGWRRIDIGANPTGEGAVRDRVILSWAEVRRALSPEAAAKAEVQRGFAVVLPWEGAEFWSGDEHFRLGAELPGIVIQHEDGSQVSVPLVAGHPRDQLPELKSGDRIVGPGTDLEVRLETVIASEPIQDGRQGIVGYRPRGITYLTFLDRRFRGLEAALIGGGERLVWRGADGRQHAKTLTGGDRFRFLGRDALLGRFRTGAVPAQLADRELLELAAKAFTLGSLYLERGFLYRLKPALLEAARRLKQRADAPSRQASLTVLRRHLETLATSAEADGAMRVDAIRLLERLTYDRSARWWLMDTPMLEEALALQDAMNRTSGRHLERQLETYNQQVVPMMVWAAGGLRPGSSRSLDGQAGEPASARSGDVWASSLEFAGPEGWAVWSDAGQRWLSASTAVGPTLISVATQLETSGEEVSALGGRAVPAVEWHDGGWFQPAQGWRPATQAPGSTVHFVFRREIEASVVLEGVLALAASGELEVLLDGRRLYAGSGSADGGRSPFRQTLRLESGPHRLEVRVSVTLPSEMRADRAGIRLLPSDEQTWSVVEARGAVWVPPGWQAGAPSRAILRIWRPLRASARAPLTSAEWEARRLASMGLAPASELDAPANPTPSGGPEGVDSERSAAEERGVDGHGFSDLPTSHTWLWVDEPGEVTSAGGRRFLVLTLQTELAGTRRIRLDTTAAIRRTFFQGQPQSVVWGRLESDTLPTDSMGIAGQIEPSPPAFSTAQVLELDLPAGHSQLLLELEQPPTPTHRVTDSPLVFEGGHPVGFKARTVTWRSGRSRRGQSRAAILDSDGASRMALVVERGVGGLREGLEILLGEHHGQGHTALYFPRGTGRHLLAKLPSELTLELTLPKGEMGAQIEFIPLVSGRFYRQEDASKPPFLPFGGFRVRKNRREVFRSDRDLLRLPHRQVEYVTHHGVMARGDLLVVTARDLLGLLIDPLPDGWGLGTEGEGAWLELQTEGGQTRVWSRGMADVSVIRPGRGTLVVGEEGRLLKDGDRLWVGALGLLIRCDARGGILAPRLEAASDPRVRVWPGLGLEGLFGPADATGTGLERIFDTLLSGGMLDGNSGKDGATGMGGSVGMGAVAAADGSLQLTLDDDLQRYAREQLLRQLALLRQLGPAAAETEKGRLGLAHEPPVQGALVLMDAVSGGILAAVSEGPGSEDGDTTRPWLPWQGIRSHPGSTFKLVTALAGLESDDPAVVSLLSGRLPKGLRRDGGRSLRGVVLPPLAPRDTPLHLDVGLKNHRRAPIPAGTDLPGALRRSLNTYFGYLSLLLHRPTRQGWGDAGIVDDAQLNRAFPLHGVAERLGFNTVGDLMPRRFSVTAGATGATGGSRGAWGTGRGTEAMGATGATGATGVTAATGLWRLPPSLDRTHRVLRTGDRLVVSPSLFPRGPLPPSAVATVGIGQGEVYASPLQMAMVAAAYATGGILQPPSLVKAIDHRTPSARSTHPDGQRMGSKADIQKIRRGMKAVVSKGSASMAFVDSWIEPSVYGKTGTAERPARGGGTVNDSWFVGFVLPPALDPAEVSPGHHPLAFACWLPAAGLGGRHCADVVDRLLRDVGRYYGWTQGRPQRGSR